MVNSNQRTISVFPAFKVEAHGVVASTGSLSKLHISFAKQRREQFLTNVAFFATWMSRDSVYIAPDDAQRSIIDAWRRWYFNQDENWRPVVEPSTDDWYF